MKTIKFNVFLFVIIGILIGCNSKSETKETSSVSEKDIYEIVNDVCQNLDKTTKEEGQTYFYLLDNDSIYFGETRKTRISLNNYFSKEDIQFIIKQIQLNDSFKFKNEFLNSKQVLHSKIISQLIVESKKSKNNFHELYKKKFGKKLFCSISVPLFSLDKKTAFVEINKMHGGFSLLFKKVNGKWQSEVLLIWT